MSSDSTAAKATAGTGRTILHNEAAHRFETVADGQHCVLDYTLDGAVATYYHTGVPTAVEGRGIAAELTRTALDTARARGWRVKPACSYVAAYMQKHPEYQDLRA